MKNYLIILSLIILTGCSVQVRPYSSLYVPNEYKEKAAELYKESFNNYMNNKNTGYSPAHGAASEYAERAVLVVYGIPYVETNKCTVWEHGIK